MNRRNFLKSIIAMIGAAAVPSALVEACNIESPVPKGWLVGLLDINGNIFAQMEAESFEKVVFPESDRSATVTHCFIEGEGLGGRKIIPLTFFSSVCFGDTITLMTDISIVEAWRKNQFLKNSSA